MGVFSMTIKKHNFLWILFFFFNAHAMNIGVNSEVTQSTSRSLSIDTTTSTTVDQNLSVDIAHDSVVEKCSVEAEKGNIKYLETQESLLKLQLDQSSNPQAIEKIQARLDAIAQIKHDAGFFHIGSAQSSSLALDVPTVDASLTSHSSDIQLGETKLFHAPTPVKYAHHASPGHIEHLSGGACNIIISNGDLYYLLPENVQQIMNRLTADQVVAVMQGNGSPLINYVEHNPHLFHKLDVPEDLKPKPSQSSSSSTRQHCADVVQQVRSASASTSFHEQVMSSPIIEYTTCTVQR